MKLHRPSILLALLLILPLLCSAQVPGKMKVAGPVDITAETLHYDRENSVYTAKGAVEMIEGTRTLKADFVTYNEITEDVLAEGNVVFREEDDQVEADRLTINLATKLGAIEKGKIFLSKGNFYISGEEITKTGEATYVIQRGEFTTCGWDRPAWKFSARDVRIKVQGVATARSANFRILGKPVLYLPYGIFPVVTQRQSGLLLPELTLSSRDGVIFSEAFFWAIAKDRDATFYLDVIGKRGVKPGAEYRYALTDTLKGEWYGSIIDDRDYGHTRYEVKGEHEQVIKDLSLKSRVDYVSDIDYLKDFGDISLNRSENLLKSTAFAEKPFGESLLTVETSYFKTLLQKDNDTTFKYLPFASYFLQYMPVIRNMFYVNLSSDVLNLYREQGDKFTRFTLAPALHIPYYWNGLNFLFGATGYEKIYAIKRDQPTDSKGTKRLESAKLEADVNAQFIRNSSTNLFGIGQFQSLIKPRVRYTYVPNAGVHDIPEIDTSDHISQVNTVTYSFNHYLTAVSKDNVNQISSFEVEQSYGLSDDLTPSDLYDGSGKRFSDIRARLTLYPGGGLSTTHESVFNPYGDGFRILRNSLSYANPPHFKFDIGQSYTKDLVNEVNTGFLGTYGNFDGIFRIRYSLTDSTWIDSTYAITYHPKCWSVTLSMARTRRPNDTSVKISFDLAGITERSRDPYKIGSYRTGATNAGSAGTSKGE
jgi:LPS-assembly protein